MAAKLLVPADEEDEFIDMEINSFSNFLLSHTPSPPNPNSSEFEFHMSSSSSSIFQHRAAAYSSTSPADELFYKGKLLPLQFPRRLQMLQQLLQNEQNHSSPVSYIGSVNDSISYNRSQSNHNQKDYGFDHEFYCTPLMTSSYSTPITVTPFESYNASPNESFRVNDVNEIFNPEEEEEEKEHDFAEKNQKKTKKKIRRRMEQQKKQYFPLVSKLRTWFGKVSCKYELASVTKKVADEGSASTKAREINNSNHHKQKNEKVVGKINKYPFRHIIQRSDRDRFRSFSSRIEFRSIDIDNTDNPDEERKCENNGSKNRIMRSSLVSDKLCFNGSSSFSGLPNKSGGSCQELEIGNLIMGAIAHCKQSHLISSASIRNS